MSAASEKQENLNAPFDFVFDGSELRIFLGSTDVTSEIRDIFGWDWIEDHKRSMVPRGEEWHREQRRQADREASL